MPMVKSTGKSIETNWLDVPMFFVSCNEDIMSWPFPSLSYPITLSPPPREGGYSSVNTQTHIHQMNMSFLPQVHQDLQDEQECLDQLALLKKKKKILELDGVTTVESS